MPNDFIHYRIEAQQLILQGDWVIASLPKLQTAFKNIAWPNKGHIIVNGQALTKMDSAGAWLLNQWRKKMEESGVTLDFVEFPSKHNRLLSMVHTILHKEKEHNPKTTKINRLAKLGQLTLEQLKEFQLYLAFIGHLTHEMGRIIKRPRHFRLQSIASIIYKSGYQALPIIALLSFMIGIVITYQMGLQLKNYGANIYIVDLLGLSILREFGPLLTAIMVAGRTGSAFTAQLGMMKINQEIDALNTMGVTPAELLLLPKILGLCIALPLITLWADAFGVFGGMIMANGMLSITWYDFLHRFPTVIPLRALLIGLGKTPVFALIISSIGCYQGMKVGGSADSVGRNTTRSVVLAIFFIIVTDAIFSIVLSKLKL